MIYQLQGTGFKIGHSEGNKMWNQENCAIGN